MFQIITLLREAINNYRDLSYGKTAGVSLNLFNNLSRLGKKRRFYS